MPSIVVKTAAETPTKSLPAAPSIKTCRCRSESATFAAVALALFSLAASAPGCKGDKAGEGPGSRDTSAPPPSGDSSAPGADVSGPSGAITRASVVNALATCTDEVNRRFLPAAEALVAATKTLAADGAPSNWEASRSAWAAAMERWQELEVFQFGPLASPANSPGGKDLRDKVYAWPLGGRCAVEQVLVRQRYKAADFVSAGVVTERGLGAIEYLLFHVGTDNGCTPSVSINADGSWAALAATPDELAKRKREYAAVLADDVALRARELVDAWDASKGNFRGELTRAGAGSPLFASAQVALNALSHALFYMEKPVKDVKLGRPLGLEPECGQMACPEQLESQFAHRSKSHLARNLAGFELLALGCPGTGNVGFDDLLAAEGRSDMADKLRAAVAGVKPALDAISGDDLTPALMNDRARVEALYAAVRVLVTFLRTEFVSVLNLGLPASVAGDNDV